MFDQTHARGDASAVEDDFEWVNAWAATLRPAPIAAPTAAPAANLAIADAGPAQAHARPAESGGSIVMSRPTPAAAGSGEAPIAIDRVATSAAAARGAVVEAGSPLPDPAVNAAPATAAHVASTLHAVEATAADATDTDAATARLAEGGSAAIPPFDAERRIGRKRWTNLFRMIVRESEPDLRAANELAEAAPESHAAHDAEAEPILAADQLRRDIADIVFIRDRLLAEAAAEERKKRSVARFARMRTSDYVPILVGGVLAFTSLVVFGAAASFVSLR